MYGFKHLLVENCNYRFCNWVTQYILPSFIPLIKLIKLSKVFKGQACPNEFPGQNSCRTRPCNSKKDVLANFESKYKLHKRNTLGSKWKIDKFKKKFELLCFKKSTGKNISLLGKFFGIKQVILKIIIIIYIIITYLTESKIFFSYLILFSLKDKNKKYLNPWF